MKKNKEQQKKGEAENRLLSEVILGTVLIGIIFLLDFKREKEEIKQKKTRLRIIKESFNNYVVYLILGLILVSIYYYQIYIDEATHFSGYCIGLIGGYLIGISLANVKFSKKQQL